MKIRLVDKTTYNISRADITNGRFEIDFVDKTSEEIEQICSVPANFEEIELLTDSDEVFAEDIKGWTVYGGVLLLNGVKTAIMTKAPNVTEERLTTAEANALEAKTAAQEQAAEIEKMQEQIAEVGGVDYELFDATAVVARANAQALTDAEALEAKVLYPNWSPNSIEYTTGYKVLYEDILYKCISEHTSQESWAPGVAPSLWTAIESGEHAGTLEDPIPVPDTVTTAGMEYEKGKYYSEGDTVYLMDRQGMNEGEKVTLYYAPSALIGQYFSVAS